MSCRFCHRWQTRRVCFILGLRSRWNSTHRDGMSLLQKSLLSALAASFLFRKQLRPSRPHAFFLPGPGEEKAARQRISVLGDEWGYVGCTPPYLTLSPQRLFTYSLHPLGPASLCGCEQSGLIQWKQWWRDGWQPVFAASDAEELSGSYHDPATLHLHSPAHLAQAWAPIFSASCLTLWRSWVWNGLPQRNRPVAAWMNGSCQGAARPLVNELRHSSQRSMMRSPNLAVHPTHPAYVPLLPPPSLQLTAQKKRIRQPASPGWVSGCTSLPAHGHWLEGKSRPPIQTL